MLNVKTIHNPRYERLIECLIDARKSQHLTQVQLADELDKPQSYIAKIEGRERKIDIIEFFELCKQLNVNPINRLQTVFISNETLNN